MTVSAGHTDLTRISDDRSFNHGGSMLDTGNYHLICSDAFVELPKLPPNSVDALITDPPYCSGGTFASDRTQRNPASKYEQTASSSENCVISVCAITSSASGTKRSR